MKMEEVILVDEKDNAIGVMEKQLAHEKGLLHRAFSVIIFNDKGQMLIHRRAKEKYHCGGLWTNACCSHPRKNEPIDIAAKRRLHEEMGFSCMLNYVYAFTYKIDFDNGLSEHEYDHIFVGSHNHNPKPNPHEVSDWKFIDISFLKQDIKAHPNKYTFWFKKIIKNHLKDILKKHNNNDKSLQKNDI